MADRFYSVVLGEMNPDAVTEGASTSSEAVELRVASTVYSNKIWVLQALMAIANYIKTKETTPIA